MASGVPLKVLEIASLYTHPGFLTQFSKSISKQGEVALLDCAVLINQALQNKNRHEQQDLFQHIYNTYIKNNETWNLIKPANEVAETIRSALITQSSPPTTFNPEIFIELKTHLEARMQSHFDHFLEDQEEKLSKIVDFLVSKVDEHMKLHPDKEKNV
jgi:hypothetical protein